MTVHVEVVVAATHQDYADIRALVQEHIVCGTPPAENGSVIADPAPATARPRRSTADSN